MNRTQLEQILSTKSVKYKEGNKLIVWGAGATADLYMEAFQRLKKEGFYIDGYCDNNPNIQGKSYNGKTVYQSLSVFVQHNQKYIGLSQNNWKKWNSPIATQMK